VPKRALTQFAFGIAEDRDGHAPPILS
jgi:hypothetical protein